MSKALFHVGFAGDPWFNMGFDEWLLARASARPGAVYMRLYTWEIPTITFGYNQRQDTALDFNQVGETPVIRRVTGGRALYHDLSELTYSVAINTEAGPGAAIAGSIAETSKTIAMALTGFLDRLGIASNYVRQSSPENNRPEVFHKAPCFTSVSRYELMSGGKKIIASAQKKMTTALLQHGSIKISGVAEHPALTGDLSAADLTKQAVDIDRFNDSAAMFVQALNEAFRVQAIDWQLSENHVNELEEIRLRVKKNALSRRVIVEQN